MSFYQNLKPVILNFFEVSKDAIHIHVGFACLVLTLLSLPKKAKSFQVLIPGFIVSIVMELLDFWDDYSASGQVNVRASLHDLVNTNFIPVVIVLLFKYRLKLSGDRDA